MCIPVLTNLLTLWAISNEMLSDLIELRMKNENKYLFYLTMDISISGMWQMPTYLLLHSPETHTYSRRSKISKKFV